MKPLDRVRENVNNLINGLYKQEAILRICEEAAAYGKVDKEDVVFVLDIVQTIRKELMIQAEAVQGALFDLSTETKTEHGKAGKGTQSG